MGDFINCMAQIATIAGVVGGGINFIVIRPLGVMIVQLKDVVQDLQRTIKEAEIARQDMDKRLVRVEESTKSAHHRIDGFEEAIRR